MAYYTRTELLQLGLKYVGKKVKISKRTAIYDAERISIGDFSRIDDFCLISGTVSIGKYCHITPQCLISGGKPGVFIEDFCTMAYGVRLFAQTDDYSGKSMTNSLIPQKFKNEKLAAVTVKTLSILGAGSCVMPGVTIGEGCAVGAMSLVTKSIAPWGLYYGVPAKRIRDRQKNVHDLKVQFLSELGHEDSF